MVGEQSAKSRGARSSNRFPRGSECTVHRDVPSRHHVSEIIIKTRLAVPENVYI